MERVVHLSLYGSIDHPGPEYDWVWDMFQSSPLTRLRDISLSSTPSRFAAHGMAASRFEHSVGVSYLARKLCDWRAPLREDSKLLIAAALCHDIGSPPFSHISELFMYDLVGRTHEEQTERLLSAGTELSELLRGAGVDPAEVVEIINGRHERLGPLIAGSIDLDNIDNSLHLLVSLGYDIEPYHPLRLLKAYRIKNDKIAIDTSYLSEVVGWAEARKTLYELLHAELNLSSATMLYRSLEFAYAGNYLDEEFFEMGESDALHELRRHSGRQAGKLIERALSWHQYPCIHLVANREEDPRLVSLYQDWKARKRFTDRLARDLGIDPIDFGLYVGRDRAEKSIELPFVGEYADAVTELFANRSGPQRLALFADKPYLRLKGTKKLDQALERAVDELPESLGSSHTFF